MATIYTHKDSNIRKTWVLMAGFFIFIIAIGWVFSQAYGDPVILYAAVIISFIFNFASYWWSDKVALALTRAREVSNEGEFRELHRVVENLAITAGLPKPKVYVINDPAPNAFATGRNPKTAVVAVTTGLLSTLDRSELEGVLAHELSHVGNRDILVSTVAVVLAGCVAIVSDIFLRVTFWGRRGSDDNRAGALFLIIGIVAAILAPLAATLIRLAISRKREFLADASGALLTRYPEGLASALEKISSYGRPMARASDATAHLFIANPFGARALKGIQRLFNTHPSIEERIAILRRMG